jgi:hypothetical protein
MSNQWAGGAKIEVNVTCDMLFKSYDGFISNNKRIIIYNTKRRFSWHIIKCVHKVHVHLYNIHLEC